MPFIIHNIVPPTVLDTWTMMGELVVLIWHTKIVDTEVYLVSFYLWKLSPLTFVRQANLSRKIEDFLNIVFSTERYKSFNHVFHLSCIYSNCQVPSRDSCKTFSQQDIMKHITTGGYWYDPMVKTWVQGGEMVLGYCDKHPEQGRLLGIPNSGCSMPISGQSNDSLCHSMTITNLHIGSGKIETTPTAAGKTAQKDAVPWKTTRCAKILRTDRPGVTHHLGKSMVTRQGEHVHSEGHVIFQHPADGKVRLVFLTFIVPAN
jgi:hypothetical protein